MEPNHLWPNLAQTELLKACLLSGDAARTAWEKWTRQIDFDRLDPASYKLLPLLSRNPDLQSLRHPIFEKCKGVYRQTWVDNQLKWQKALPVLTDLRKLGIDKIVLLKGMAMILHYYQDFGVRVIGDIDLLIKRAQAPIAGTFLKTLGGRLPWNRFDLNNPEHLARWHALNFKLADGTNLDLHWSFIEENCSALDESVLKLAIPTGLFYVPNPTDLLLQTCVHGTKYSPVPLIRWVADAMTLLKLSIDWDRLIELGKTAHVSLHLLSAFQFLTEHFNAPIPQSTLTQLKTRTPTPLEQRTYHSSLQTPTIKNSWYRYCLNRGYTTLFSQILHLPAYLQTTARLSSPWQLPFFGTYWLLKRLKNSLLTPSSQIKKT